MSLIRRDVLESLQRMLFAILVMLFLIAVTLGIRAAWTRASPPDGTLLSSQSAGREGDVPPAAVEETVFPNASVSGAIGTAAAKKIGIVVGHWQHDSGAVCPDGLQEVDINFSVAQSVVTLLAREGYAAEILAEFAPELPQP